MKTPPIPHPPLDTIVYSRSGQRAKYICSVVGRYSPEHFVKPEVEFGLPDGEVDSSFEGAAIWHEYFLTPPREVIDKEIAALEAKAEALRLDIQKIRAEKAAIEQELSQGAEARKTRFAQHTALERIDHFIQHGIAGYVVERYSDISIVDFKDTKCDDNGYGRRGQFKLLTLFGCSDGDLSWCLNDYRDGSGTSHRCVPYATEDEKQKAVETMFSEVVQRWIKDETRADYTALRIVNNAKRLGLTSLPVLVQEAAVRAGRKCKQDFLKAAEEKFVAAQTELIKAREGVVDSTEVPKRAVATKAVS